VIGAVSAEWLKIRKRPAVWVLAGVLLGILALLGYALTWFFLSNPPRGSTFPPGTSAADFKKAVYPVNFVRNALSGSGTVGSAIALILGVLTVGSEFGWGTFKTVYTQRPGRITALCARLVVLGATVAIFVLAFYLTAAVCSVVLALVDGVAIVWPNPYDIVRALASTWLTWSLWTGFGVTLSFLFRQAALAIGLGLVYQLIVEGLVFSILRNLPGESFRTVQKFFPGPNAEALVQSFGQVVPLRGQPPPLVGPVQAALVLAAYLLAFLIFSAFLVRRRDVT
jgi:ABC-type transport system involved in multi-copper enzyme maturation permease subunit